MTKYMFLIFSQHLASSPSASLMSPQPVGDFSKESFSIWPARSQMTRCCSIYSTTFQQISKARALPLQSPTLLWTTTLLAWAIRKCHGVEHPSSLSMSEFSYRNIMSRNGQKSYICWNLLTFYMYFYVIVIDVIDVIVLIVLQCHVCGFENLRSRQFRLLLVALFRKPGKSRRAVWHFLLRWAPWKSHSHGFKGCLECGECSYPGWKLKTFEDYCYVSLCGDVWCM